MKYFYRVIKTWLVLAVMSLPVSAAEVVNVYNWSDYIDESILTDFEAETGIKVVYDVFDSNDVLETKLLAGGSGYDVVVPTAAFLGRQIQAGVYRKLDKSKLSNAKHMWPLVEKRLDYFDPGNQYSANYMWGTTGIGYNVDKVKALLPNADTESWGLALDVENIKKLASCGVYLLDAADEIVPIVLAYMGEDPTTTDIKVMNKAKSILKAIRPYVAKFNSSEYINALANGDICLAIGWSGDILQARDRASEAGNGVEVSYYIPKEGTLMWFDQMAIPADAKNYENALTFINYIMRPEVMAKASNYVYFANGNLSSQQHLNDDVINDTAIYPDEKTLENLFVVPIYPQKTQRALTRLWTNVKSNL